MWLGGRFALPGMQVVRESSALTSGTRRKRRRVRPRAELTTITDESGRFYNVSSRMRILPPALAVRHAPRLDDGILLGDLPCPAGHARSRRLRGAGSH